MSPLLGLAAIVPALLWLRNDLLYSALHGRYFATTANDWFLVSELLSDPVETRSTARARSIPRVRSSS
jgi:hypothetical protein